MKLREVAHARAGDKGDTINIAVMAWRAEDYPLIKQRLSAQKVKAFFGERCRGEVTRYELDGLRALNFVLEHSLGGGSSRTLGLDALGRSTAGALLDMEL